MNLNEIPEKLARISDELHETVAVVDELRYSLKLPDRADELRNEAVDAGAAIHERVELRCPMCRTRRIFESGILAPCQQCGDAARYLEFIGRFS